MYRIVVFGCLLFTSIGSVAAQPNVILITFGGYGAEWMGCYDGGSPSLTPNIDALAAGGMKLTNVWAMPKSQVTRVSMLTGQYPYRHGWVNQWDVPRWGRGCYFDPGKYRTFANVLRDAGYTTAIAGKWQLNDFRKQPMVLNGFGFDAWCVWAGSENGNPMSDRRYWEPYMHTRDGSEVYKKQLSIDVCTDFLIDFIEKNNKKPYGIFFPMVLPYKPHKFPSGKSVNDKDGKAAVVAMVRHADAAIGRLIKAIDARSVDRETVVVVTATHSIGRPGFKCVPGERAAKKLSDRGCGVPLIVRWPRRVAAGSSSNGLVDVTDLAPTLAELAGGEGLPAPASDWDGVSIIPQLIGRAEQTEKSFRLAMGGGIAVVVDGQVRPAQEWAPRMIGDRRFFAIFEQPYTPVAFIDMDAKEASKKNAMKYPTAASNAALASFAAEIGKLPAEDAWPAYELLPELKRVEIQGSPK